MVESHLHTSNSYLTANSAWRSLRTLLLLWLAALSALTFSLPFASAAWLDRPSLGALVLPGMRVGAILSPAAVAALPGGARLQPGDRLLRVDGRAVPNGAALWASLENKKSGQEVFLSVETAQGEYVTRIQVLQPWPRYWQVRLNDFPIGLGMLLLALAWLIFLRLPDQPTNRALTLLTTALSFVLAGSVDLWQTHRLTLLWLLAFALTAAALFDLSLSTSEWALRSKWPIWLRRFGYVGTLLVTLVAGSLYLHNPANLMSMGWRLELIWLLVSGLGAMAILIFAARHADNAPQRNRSLGLLAAELLSIPALYLWAGTLLLHLSQPDMATPILAAFTLAAPLTAALNQSRSAITSPQRLLWQVGLYALAGIGYAFVVAGIVTGLSIFNLTLRPILTGIVFALLALTLLPLYRGIEKNLDALFMPGERIRQERLNRFIRDLTHAVELPEILNILRTTLQETLRPTLLHIYLYDPLGDQYVATPDVNGQPTSDIRFAANSSLVQTLRQQSSPLYVSNP
ncbi:MAG: hypothetical protein N3A60_05115, partial [Thermanaerothrix sp.]|nr:hypothetical protein [Thermanaerothrix sp.]